MKSWKHVGDVVLRIVDKLEAKRLHQTAHLETERTKKHDASKETDSDYSRSTGPRHSAFSVGGPA